MNNYIRKSKKQPSSVMWQTGKTGTPTDMKRSCNIIMYSP